MKRTLALAAVAATAAGVLVTTSSAGAAGTGSISGRAVSAAGHQGGVGGVAVSLYGPVADGPFARIGEVATTTTAANGTYSFTGLADDLGYQVCFSPFAAGRYEAQCDGGHPWYPQLGDTGFGGVQVPGDAIAVSGGAAVTGIDAALLPASYLTGHVTLAGNGAAAPDVPVTAVSPSGGLYSTSTDAAGDYAFPVKPAPGAYTISFTTTYANAPSGQPITTIAGGGPYVVAAHTPEPVRTTAVSSMEIRTQIAADGVLGRAYNSRLIAGGGKGGLTWSADPATLPPGLKVSSGGVVTGVPRAFGVFEIAVTVHDSLKPVRGLAHRTVFVPVAPMTISPATLPAGTAHKPYHATLSTVGGIGNRSWSLASGSLPPGVRLSPFGQLYGTPTAAGSYDVTVQVTDGNKPTPDVAVQVYELVIS